jgi:hypothetical protein
MCGKQNKIVNVVINSNNAISGSVNNNATYNIDFGAILKPRTPYKLHWTYVGQPNVLTALSKLAQVQINFNMEQYLNASSNLGAPVTQTLGMLRSAYLNGSINNLYAGDNDNPPIYLNSRPQANNFNVRILTNDATPVLWTDNTATPVVNGNYMLILSFQEMRNMDD